MLIAESSSTSGSGSDALANVSALRTFRVLRALKTVAVVPGKDKCAKRYQSSCFHAVAMWILYFRFITS